MTNTTVTRLTFALFVSIAAGAGLASCSTSASAVGQDIAVSACRADPAGGSPTAEGTIVNHSSKASAYAFRVSFTDPAGNSVSQGAVTVGNVAVGATAKWHASGAASAKGALKCKVDSAVRTAAP